MAEKEAKKKVKQTSARKRELQSERARVRNKAYRSKVSSAVKDFMGHLATAQAKDDLNKVYSLVDKGVKKGILNLNKAGRIKSRLTKKIAAAK